jgi:hypothetical protein
MNDFEKLKQKITYDLIIFCMLPKTIFNLNKKER